MHILHLTPYYAPAYAFGGVVRSVEGMARALARRGHTVTVLTTDALNQNARYDDSADEIREGVRVVRAANLSPTLRGRYNLSTPNKLHKLAQELLPAADVVHCHEFRTTENLMVTRLAAEMNKPLVLSPHGTLTPETGRSGLKALWDRLLSPAVARRFDHIIGLTEAESAEVQMIWPRFGRRRISAAFSVIPNGVDPADYENLSGRDSFRHWYGLGDAVVCLFMGRLHERKGAHKLVEAFKQANIPNTRLVIAGPDEGMLATIQAMADERIVITGYLDGEERLAALASADMLALPAVGEGLPMVVLEAMAAGLPVIVSPECHLPEIAQHSAGIETKPEIAALTNALQQLLTDGEKRKQMGAAARQLVQERFTWDAVAEQLETVYGKLLGA